MTIHTTRVLLFKVEFIFVYLGLLFILSIQATDVENVSGVSFLGYFRLS